MAEYKIYGPGSSSGSPVYQEVACSETSTDICFIVSSTTKVDDCFTDTIFEKKCMPVDLSTLFPIDCSCVSADTKPILMSGETSWGETVWYEIKQIRDICQDEDPSEPISRSCDIGDYWITKSGHTLFIDYECFKTLDYGDYVDVERSVSSATAQCKSVGCFITGISGGTDKNGKYYINNPDGVASFTSTEDSEITIETCCSGKSITFIYDCSNGGEKTCLIDPTSASCIYKTDDIGRILLPKSGCTVEFAGIDVEVDCIAGVSYNIKNIIFNPPYVENSGGSVNMTIVYERVIKDSECNETKTTGVIKSGITISACTDYPESSGDCFYDHYVDIPLLPLLTELKGGDIYYNGKKVDESTTVSYLELGEEHGGGEGCEYETTYCVDSGTVKVYYESSYKAADWSEQGEVPSSGGRIKVAWNYKKVEIPTQSSPAACKTYSSNTLTASEIVKIPECPGDRATSAFTGDILWYKQSSGCTTCPYEEYKGDRLNKITYSGYQDCYCESYTTTTVKEKAIITNVDKCTNCVVGSPTIETITYGVEMPDGTCSATTSTTSVEMTKCFGVNSTDKSRTIEDEYFKITQEAGPCNISYCDCGTFRFYNRAQPTTSCESEALTFDFPEVSIGCSNVSKVTIPYRGYCRGVLQVSGNLTWEDNFVCDKAQQDLSGATTHTYTFPEDGVTPWSGKTITVIQCKDGTCDCNCDTDCE